MTYQNNKRSARSFGPKKSNYKSNPRPNKGPKGRYNSGQNRNKFRGSKKGGRPSFNPSDFINENPIKTETEIYQAQNTFETFGLSDQLQKSVTALGIKTPTPIQDQAIPHILNGRDVVGLAGTGTGKTAAFLLPLLEKTVKNKQKNINSQTLILAPTRELAIQIDQELKKLKPQVQIFSTVCVGGAPIFHQIKSLKRLNHFVIGTPGRIIDLINRKALNLSKTDSIVLDEADRMLDMGFIGDMKTILSNVPDNRQTLFFSATMNDSARKLVADFMRDPIEISVKKTESAEGVKQNVVRYGHNDKFDTLLSLLKKNDIFSRVIIFGAMKHSVQRLSDELNDLGIKSVAIHGNKTHPQRQKSLNSFKSGNARVLVATDVAARGIHVDKISHVINYDLPASREDYIHRIGRTGRGEESGQALTFITQPKP